MKLSVLIISLLALIPSVYAQTNIKILGKEYPLLLVIPVILVIIFGVFFIANYLKENLHIKGLNLSFLKFKKHKEENKKIITRNYLGEIIKLEKDVNSLGIEKSLDKFDNIAKDFFSDAFNINYEFTYSELQQEMAKKGVNIDKFIEKIDDVRYSGKEVTSKEIATLLGQLRCIVRNYIVKQSQPLREKKESSLFSFIGSKLHAIKLKKIHKGIKHKIERGKQNIPTDLESSMKDYLSATLDYYKIPERRNDDLYKKIQELHEELRETKFHNKEIMKLAKNLIDLKHKNKQVSVEGINLINKLKKALQHPLIRFERFIEKEEDVVEHNVKDIEHGIEEVGHNIGSFGKKVERTLVKDFDKLKDDEKKVARFVKHDINEFEEGVKKLGRGFEHYNEELDNKMLDVLDKISNGKKHIIKTKPIEIKQEPKVYKHELGLKKSKIIKINPPNKINLTSIKLKLPTEPKIYVPKVIRQLEQEKNIIYKRLQNIDKDFDKDKFN